MLTTDFVIVGAGSAGCVLAARLSEDPACEVILVEAGDESQLPEIHRLNQWPLLWDSSANWGYVTTRQPGLNWRVSCPRGKVLGGSSAINAMVYMRGDRGDFERWRELGNSGWGWDDVLPYFQKSEGFITRTFRLHGGDGPLTVSPQASPHPLARAFVEAAVECGHPFNPDLNGNETVGAGLLPHDDARRETVQHGHGIPPPCPRSSKPPCPDKNSDPPCFAGRWASDGSGGVSRRATREAGSEKRSHRLLRRDRLAKAVDALGHRRPICSSSHLVSRFIIR